MKISYNSYLNQVYKKNEWLEAHGYTEAIINNSDILTRDQFINAHNMLYAERKEEVKTGKRKTVGNLTRDIVQDQASLTSKNQAVKLQEAYDKLGYKVKAKADIRYGTKLTAEASAELLKIYHDLRKEGLSSKAAKVQIAKEYFGS